MNVWPPELPQRSTTSYSRSLGDARLRTETDAGGGTMRRRLSYVPQPVECAFEMTQAQRERFELFVDRDLKGGVLPFQMPSLDGAGTWVVQIGQGMPRWSPLGTSWQVSMNLVRLPQ